MTPTLPFDVRFKGVGRVKLRSGVRDPRTLRRMVDRFREMCEHARGRELVRAMKRGEIKPFELYDLARSGDFSDLPAPETMQPLSVAWPKWITAAEYSDDHARNLRKELRRFERVKPGLTARDLPAVIESLRESMTKTPRSFNLARVAAMAFLRSKFKRSNPLYIAVWGIDSLKTKPTRKAPDLGLSDVESFGHEAIEMAATGMIPKEYWSRAYSIEGGALRIRGTKREGRDRRVPLILPIEGPRVSLMTFRRRVRKASDFAVQAKDFRNVFAWLLEEAGIPRTRRRLYMGHGRKDTTDIYEEREVRRFLAEDAATITAARARIILHEKSKNHTLSYTHAAQKRSGKTG